MPFGNRGPGSNYSQMESMWVRMLGDPSAAKDSTVYKTFAGISEDGLTATGYLDTPEAIQGMKNYQALFSEGLSPKGVVAAGLSAGVALSVAALWATARVGGALEERIADEDDPVAPPDRKRGARPKERSRRSVGRA